MSIRKIVLASVAVLLATSQTILQTVNANTPLAIVPEEIYTSQCFDRSRYDGVNWSCYIDTESGSTLSPQKKESEKYHKIGVDNIYSATTGAKSYLFTSSWLKDLWPTSHSYVISVPYQSCSCGLAACCYTAYRSETVNVQGTIIWNKTETFWANGDLREVAYTNTEGKTEIYLVSKNGDFLQIGFWGIMPLVDKNIVYKFDGTSINTYKITQDSTGLHLNTLLSSFTATGTVFPVPPSYTSNLSSYKGSDMNFPVHIKIQTKEQYNNVYWYRGGDGRTYVFDLLTLKNEPLVSYSWWDNITGYEDLCWTIPYTWPVGSTALSVMFSQVCDVNDIQKNKSFMLNYDYKTEQFGKATPITSSGEIVSFVSSFQNPYLYVVTDNHTNLEVKWWNAMCSEPWYNQCTYNAQQEKNLCFGSSGWSAVECGDGFQIDTSGVNNNTFIKGKTNPWSGSGSMPTDTLDDLYNPAIFHLFNACTAEENTWIFGSIKCALIDFVNSITEKIGIAVRDAVLWFLDKTGVKNVLDTLDFRLPPSPNLIFYSVPVPSLNPLWVTLKDVSIDYRKMNISIIKLPVPVMESINPELSKAFLTIIFIGLYFLFYFLFIKFVFSFFVYLRKFLDYFPFILHISDTGGGNVWTMIFFWIFSVSLVSMLQIWLWFFSKIASIPILIISWFKTLFSSWALMLWVYPDVANSINIIIVGIVTSLALYFLYILSKQFLRLN